MIKYLIEKEFKQLWRDKFIISLIFVLPCLVMLVFPWATTMEIKNVNITVVDYDRSSVSAQMLNKLSSTEYFNFIGLASDYDEALEHIESGKSDIILEIPPSFETDITLERKSSVMIAANAVNETKANLGTSYLSAILADFASEFGGEIPVNISVESTYQFNSTMDYKVPMIPSLIVLVVTLIVGFLPSMNIVIEKENGTIEQINVTPVPKYAFILGKLIPYWIIGVVVLTLSLIVSYLMYALPPAGSILLLYGVSIFFILGISALGLIISNYSTIMQQAMFTIFFVVIIFILMSGILTPISSMPSWAQFIAFINPLTYFSEIMRLIYLKGSSFKDLLPYIKPLVVFFVFIISWAILSYKKRG